MQLMMTVTTRLLYKMSSVVQVIPMISKTETLADYEIGIRELELDRNKATNQLMNYLMQFQTLLIIELVLALSQIDKAMEIEPNNVEVYQVLISQLR